MKVLRLDRDQARLLATWLRIAAVQMEKQADHLLSCGKSFAEPERMARQEVARVRALAERLEGDSHRGAGGV